MKSAAIGAEFRVARKKLGLSQSQLARVFHCPATTVSRWERADIIHFGAVTGVIYRAIVWASKQDDCRVIGEEINKYNEFNDREECESTALVFVLSLYFQGIGAL